MANLGQSYSTKDLPKGDNNFEPIPGPIWYQAKIAKTEQKNTQAGTGKYIAIRFDILGPTHQGRVVFTNLNIRNPNPEAEKIAHQQLNDILESIGLSEIDDDEQLVGHTLEIKVVVKPASGQYEAGNEVKGYRAIKGGAPSGSAAPAASGAAKTAPWKK